MGAMPELPDLSILADAFTAALVGRPLERAAADAPLAVRGTPAELAALAGQELTGVTRTGKFLVFDLSRDRVVVNPMLTGRFQLATPGAKRPTKVAVTFAFGPRPSSPAAATLPDWTRGAAWLPADDAPAELRFRDPTQMGKVYLLPAGIGRPVPGFAPDERGPDADDPALTLDVWRERIRRRTGELKNLLRNQEFVAGIGNAYSDEILHAAGLLPFRTRASLAAEEVDGLYAAMRRTLDEAIELLRDRVPPRFEVEARDALAVHGRGGEPCPRCGTRITEVSPGGFVTSYCRGCQR